jgi:hypothetical protein
MPTKAKKPLPKHIRELLDAPDEQAVKPRTQPKRRGLDPAPPEWRAAIDRVQGEFTRLTHAVDDLKRDATVAGLSIGADIIRCCYELLDKGFVEKALWERSERGQKGKGAR